MHILNESSTNSTSFVFLTENENTNYGLDGRQNCIFISNNIDFYTKQIKRPYKKLNFITETNNFISASIHKQNLVYIYKLDENFNELDFFTIEKNYSYNAMDDIWYDNYTHMLYVLSSKTIEKYNTNGDCLGVFMCANKEKTYKAICSLDTNIFIAYEKNKSYYIAKYTNNGVFLKILNIGNELVINNMFFVKKNDEYILRVFAVKNRNCQCFIDINIDQNTNINKNLDLDLDLEIECICDDDIMSTCYVTENKTSNMY